MPNFQGRGTPFPNHRRVTTVRDPRLRGPVPALQNPQENADAVLERQIVTFNRAGSDGGNPVLSGLNVHLTIPLGEGDALRGVFLFTSHGYQGPNLIGDATVEAPGVWGIDLLVGSGRSKAGTPELGAIRNLVRIVTAKGSFERQFYAKSYDADIITLNGEAALDPDTLEAVELVAEIVDDSRDWLDIKTDFFGSWNDAFQVLNSRNDADQAAGFKKANGGALFVSFFDKTPGTEGVGTQVNPLTQVAVDTRRKIQIENTVGLKEIVARFRSKQDSLFFVDIPIKISVIDQTESCASPVAENCGAQLLLRGTAAPANTPTEASVVGEQVVVGTEGEELDRDLLYLSVHGASVGATQNLLVRKFKAVESGQDLGGFKYVQVGDDLEFKPLRLPAATPAPGGDYNDAEMLVVVMDVQADRNQQVALYLLSVKDGDHYSPSFPFPGPSSRDPMFFPLGGTGGQDECFY